MFLFSVCFGQKLWKVRRQDSQYIKTKFLFLYR